MRKCEVSNLKLLASLSSDLLGQRIAREVRQVAPASTSTDLWIMRKRDVRELQDEIARLAALLAKAKK